MNTRPQRLWRTSAPRASSIRGVSLASALLVVLSAASPATFAATFAPNTFIDLPKDPSDQYLTLREAVEKANATPGKDVIQLKAGNYWLTAGTAPSSMTAYWTGDGALKITDDLSIVGQLGATTSMRMMHKSGKSDRFMLVAVGVSIELKAVAIGAGGWGGRAPYGGGIFNNGNLTLRNCSIAHSEAVNSGGAVFNRGYLEAIDSTFAYNHAGRDGGAIFNDTYATAKITSSLVSTNSAGVSTQAFGGHGGGIFNSFLGQTTIRNSTVESNHAYGTLGGHGGYGGGVYNAPWGTVIVVNGGVEKNYAHRLISAGKYDGLVENFYGAPVWSYYELAPLPPWPHVPPWWTWPFP